MLSSVIVCIYLKKFSTFFFSLQVKVVMDASRLKEVKTSISRVDWGYLKRLLANQSAEFCGQALFFAIEKGVYNTKRGRNPSSTYSQECTVHENKGLVQMLLDYGADVNSINIEESKNYKGYSAFGYACRVANADIVKLLLNSKADLTLKDNNGHLPIQHAFTSNDKQVTDIFWDLGVSLDNINDLSLLCYAVKGNSEENVQKLLQMGADVDAVDKNECTALHVAIIKKELNLVQLLMENNADVNKRGNKSRTALGWAVFRERADIVKYLLEHGADVHLGAKYPLHLAITKGDKESCGEILKLLLEYGANIDQLDNQRLTPVNKAAMMGNTGALQLLLNLDAKYDHSLMMYAIQGRSKMNVEILLERGLKVSGSEMYRAVSSGCEDIVKLFLDQGVELNDQLLMPAIVTKFTSIVRMLLESGIDARASTSGRAAIIWAVIMGSKEIVELLLDFGADVNQVTMTVALGKVLLHDAAQQGDEEIFTLLLDRGADINALYLGATPMTILIQGGKVELAKMVVTQMVLMKERGLNVCQKNWDDISVNNEVVERKNECEKELEWMREDKFDDSSLSMFDIFQSKDDFQLAGWTRNENIFKAFKSDRILNKYPIYGHLIIENFKKGIQKNRDFELVKRFIKYLSTRDHDQLPGLPSTFVSDLFNYLSYYDVAILRNL